MITVKRHHGFVLGLITACGPIAVDLYLPAIPTIAREFKTDISQVQLSLVSYYWAAAFAQIFFGPLSDMFGRKRVLNWGQLIFIGGSIGCAFAPNAHMLIVLRFIEGLGASAGFAIMRAVVGDLHQGHRAANLLRIVNLVTSVSPVLAPTAGSAILTMFSWRVLFGLIALMGIVAFGVAHKFLPETNPPESRSEAGLANAVKSYRQLLSYRPYVLLILMSGAFVSATAAYIAGSPFVFMALHHLSPWHFSLFFGANAALQISCVQLTPLAMRLFGKRRLICASGTVASTAMLALLLTGFWGEPALISLFSGIMVLFFCTGLSLVPISVLVLENRNAAAGAATSLQGLSQHVFGAVGSALVTFFANGTSTPLLAVMTGGTLFATWLAFAAAKPETRMAVS